MIILIRKQICPPEFLKDCFVSIRVSMYLSGRVIVYCGNLNDEIITWVRVTMLITITVNNSND